MSRFNLRKRARVCYYEPEEPPFDEFIFCSGCRDYVYEYCSIHGPLLIIPDDKVPAVTGLPAFVPRAALTIPKVFLHIAYSRIPEAGLGVFSTLTLPSGVRFGPYRGRHHSRAPAPDSGYGWQIYDRNNKPRHVVDASDANNSNWMRYVNCSRHASEQNLVAFQYQGELYYRTVKIVPRFTELLVFYGSEFANLLGVDLRRYHKPCPCPNCQARLASEKEPAETNERKSQNEKKKETHAEENVTKAKQVEKLQEGSTSSQADSPINVDVQEISSTEPAIDTSSNKMDSNVNHFKCGQCDKSFVIKLDLEKHIQTHISLKKRKRKSWKKDFTCKKCSCTFDTRLLLLEHAQSLHGVKYFACSECEYATDIIGNLQNHLRIHTGEKPFKCGQCSAAFAWRGYLRVHQRTHTGEKTFKCGQCSAAFAHNCTLQAHQRTHTGEKPYKCGQCSAAFARSDSLQAHQRTHTGEKPFKCGQCSAAFAQSGHLRVHQRTHTGEKPYKCGQCSAAFARSGHLQNHQRTHTDEKPFECNICDYKTTWSGALKDHLMSRHSGQKPHGCDSCTYRGATRSYLRQHMKTHHKPA